MASPRSILSLDRNPKLIKNRRLQTLLQLRYSASHSNLSFFSFLDIVLNSGYPVANGNPNQSIRTYS